MVPEDTFASSVLLMLSPETVQFLTDEYLPGKHKKTQIQPLRRSGHGHRHFARSIPPVILCLPDPFCPII